MSNKITIDKKEQPDRTWYYLLDWNEKDDWKTIQSEFNKTRLLDLTNEEYWKLFDIATKQDIKDYSNI